MKCSCAGGWVEDKLCRKCAGKGRQDPVMLVYGGLRAGLAPSFSAALEMLKDSKYPDGTEVVSLFGGQILAVKVDPDITP